MKTKIKFIRVKEEAIWAIEEGINNWPNWFVDFNPTQHHAARDAREIGYSRQYISTEEITKKAFKDYVKKINKKENERMERKIAKEKELENSLLEWKFFLKEKP